MTSTQNCWEFQRCGREPGGARVAELGICPAAVDPRLDGENDGINAGRACWIIAGTLCGGQVQGTIAGKLKDCFKCGFYQKVLSEEGPDFALSTHLLAKLGLL